MSEKLMTDETVIKLLQEEAKSASRDFAAYGLGAYLPKRATTKAPKPNTRFLRNLVRETDNHNKALLAREAEEAHSRLRALRNKGEQEQAEDQRQNRKSRRSDLADHERSSAKRRRVDAVDLDRNRLSPPRESERYRDHDLDRSRSRSRSRSDPRPRKRRTSRPRSRSGEQRGQRRQDTDSDVSTKFLGLRSRNDRRKKGDEYSNAKDNEHHRSKQKVVMKYKGLRDRSISSDSSPSDKYDAGRSSSHRRSDRNCRFGEGHDHRNRHQQRRRTSPSRSRSVSSPADSYESRPRRKDHRRNADERSFRSRTRSRSPRHEGLTPKNKSGRSSGRNNARTASPIRASIKGTTQGIEAASESDPLEDILGPLPPPPATNVRIRGRGAASAFINSAAMDSRFSASYDPSADVSLDDDNDDWGQALEALEARARFKKSQGDRLRAAGFTDEEIKVWEKGGTKDESDVKWAKIGEGREWDEGKVVDEIDYGRLKGT